MFKTERDLRQFILWAKSVGVQQVSVGKVVVVFSPYAAASAAISGLEAPTTPDNLPELTEEQRLAAIKAEEDEILFHSAT